MESTTQIFMRVEISDDDLVAGEAHVGRYSGRMLIDSFSFGVKNQLQGTSVSHDKDAKKLEFDRLNVTKSFDRASTQLAALIKRREPLKEIRITVDQQLLDYGTGDDEQYSDKAQNAILVFHMHKARVVDFKLNVSEDKAGATVKETVSFTFKQFDVDYFFVGEEQRKKSGYDYRDSNVSFVSQFQTQD